MKESKALYKEAIKRFQKLYSKVLKSKLEEPTAVALATAAKDGVPSVRMVLLKEVSERGFVFYTNLKSLKGRQLTDNPRAALCFYWEGIKRQVTVEGKVELISEQEADAYWVTRDRNSQVGAWASLQSDPLPGWGTLLKRIAKYEVEFAGKKVPRPPHWTGLRLVPHKIEFWKRGVFRIHKRISYQKEDGKWTLRRLYP